MVATQLLIELWQSLLDSGVEQILHIGHSQGMIITRTTVPGMPEEMRMKIQVVGVAPGAHRWCK